MPLQLAVIMNHQYSYSMRYGINILSNLYNAVVAVPTRDVCAFCDSHSEEGIKELLGVINNIKQSTAVTISDSLLIRKGNTWHPYSLQENYV